MEPVHQAGQIGQINGSCNQELQEMGFRLADVARTRQTEGTSSLRYRSWSYPVFVGPPYFQRWGQVRKPVHDHRCRSTQVYRGRCCHGRRTFQHYPPGVDWADQTRRLRQLVAVLRELGFILRGVRLALSAFGVELSHMSVWRDALPHRAGLQILAWAVGRMDADRLRAERVGQAMGWAEACL